MSQMGVSHATYHNSSQDARGQTNILYSELKNVKRQQRPRPCSNWRAVAIKATRIKKTLRTCDPFSARNLEECIYTVRRNHTTVPPIGWRGPSKLRYRMKCSELRCENTLEMCGTKRKEKKKNVKAVSIPRQTREIRN